MCAGLLVLFTDTIHFVFKRKGKGYTTLDDESLFNENQQKMVRIVKPIDCIETIEFN